MNERRVWFCAGAVLTLSLGFVAWRLTRAEAAPVVVDQAPTELPVTPAESAEPAMAVVAPRAMDAESPLATTLLLPDGSRVACLNGAVNPKPLSEAWPRGVPYSPIVRIERSDIGVDWYVHADGSRSTTEMKWRADLGRMDAVTSLGRPAPAPPAIAPPAVTGHAGQ